MTRRGNNEGSITRRSDGRWEAKASLGFRADGKPVRKSFYGKTKTEARNKMNEAIRQHATGMPVDFQRQTVAQFLTSWLENTAKPSVRPRTYSSYSQLVQQHIIPAIGRHQLSKLTPQHVERMLNYMSAKGRAPRTVQNVRAVLRRALGTAMKYGLVARNVAALVDPPRSVRYEHVYLDDAQAKRFLDAVTGDPLEALYNVALWLGLRQGEILGLRWADVDFDNLALSVRNQLQRIDGKLTLTEPKTSQSRRTLPLPNRVATKLREHRTRQIAARLAAGDKWHGGWDLVFMTRRGTPLDARDLVRAFKAILVRAGLPDMRFHDLRHSSATLLLAYGASPREVMQTLGHAQIAMTMNVYTHVVPELQRRTADRMDKLFGT